MGAEDPQATAAACRYVLIALLARLERGSPGMRAELEAGLLGDRKAMMDGGTLSPDVDAVLAEAQRMLSLVPR
jgi:hypothetical protein